MKKFTFKIGAAVLFSLSLIACETTDTIQEQVEGNDDSQESPLPIIEGADAVLAAIQTSSSIQTPIGPQTVTTDAAAASFFNGSDFYDAGTVEVNGYALSQADNNSYFLPDVGSTNLDFDFNSGSSNSWSIAGGSNVPSFTHTTTTKMVEEIALDGDYSTISPGAALTVAIDEFPMYADSVLFVLSWGSTIKTKTIGSGTSVTFSAAELSGASGTGVVQAAGYNYELKVEGGKNFYFINESVSTQFTEFK